MPRKELALASRLLADAAVLVVLALVPSVAGRLILVFGGLGGREGNGGSAARSTALARSRTPTALG